MREKKIKAKKNEVSLLNQARVSIDMSTASSVGGNTGSMLVRGRDGNFYQFKKSIKQNKSIKRQAKASFMDNENYGEILAASIAKALDQDITGPRVPLISFVLDPNSQYVGIASQYLKGKNGASVQSLDRYLDPTQKHRHIKLVSGYEDPKLGHHNLDDKIILKQELARAIALSSLVGDHDVNPGNMIVIKELNNEMRIGRIDYGHAFKDLMRFSSFGGKTVHTNNIIDFFNRNTVDGINAQSKLWRDYPGLIPSGEMAEALRSIATNPNATTNIQNAINEVKENVKWLINQPKINKKHLIESFQRIAEHVSGEKIDNNLQDIEKIDAIFNKFENYVSKNIIQMAYAAEIMQLQVDIQVAIKTEDDSQLNVFQQRYRELEEKGNSNKDIGPFAWIKEQGKIPPFEGDCSAYIVAHKKAEKLNQLAKEVDAFLAQGSEISKYERVMVRDLKAIIINPKKSVDEKFGLLDAKIKKIDNDSHSQLGWFAKIINTILSLFKLNFSEMGHSTPNHSPIENKAENSESNKTQFTDFKDKFNKMLSDEKTVEIKHEYKS